LRNQRISTPVTATWPVRSNGAGSRSRSVLL